MKEKYRPVFKHGVIDMQGYAYPRWQNISDDDIKLKLAKRYISENNRVSTWKAHRLPDGRNVTADSSDNDFIDYFNQRMAPLIPDDDEIIKRRDWACYETLLGERLDILNHPVFEKLAEYIRNNNKMQSDTLVISSCGKRKPYSRSPLIQGLITSPRKFPELRGAYDLAVLSNSGVVPVSDGNDFSFCYPFRHYDWNHSKEEEKGIIKDVEDKMHFYLREFLLKNPYKNVAIVAKTSYPSYYNIYKRLSDDLSGVNLFFAADEGNLNKFAAIAGYLDNVRTAGRKRRYGMSTHIVADILDHFGIPVPQALRDHLHKLEVQKKKEIKDCGIAHKEDS